MRTRNRVRRETVDEVRRRLFHGWIRAAELSGNSGRTFTDTAKRKMHAFAPKEESPACDICRLGVNSIRNSIVLGHVACFRHALVHGCPFSSACSTVEASRKATLAELLVETPRLPNGYAFLACALEHGHDVDFALRHAIGVEDAALLSFLISRPGVLPLDLSHCLLACGGTGHCLAELANWNLLPLSDQDFRDMCNEAIRAESVGCVRFLSTLRAFPEELRIVHPQSRSYGTLLSLIYKAGGSLSLHGWSRCVVSAIVWSRMDELTRLCRIGPACLQTHFSNGCNDGRSLLQYVVSYRRFVPDMAAPLIAAGINNDKKPLAYPPHLRTVVCRQIHFAILRRKLQRYVKMRGIFWYWFGLAAKSSCAPGGEGREQDLRALRDEFGAL